MKPLLIFFTILLFSSCVSLSEWNENRKENVAYKRVYKAHSKSPQGTRKASIELYPIQTKRDKETIYLPGKETIKIVHDSVRFNLDSLISILPKDVKYVSLPCKPDTIKSRVDTAKIVETIEKESTAKIEALEHSYAKKINDLNDDVNTQKGRVEYWKEENLKNHHNAKKFKRQLRNIYFGAGGVGLLFLILLVIKFKESILNPIRLFK